MIKTIIVSHSIYVKLVRGTVELIGMGLFTYQSYLLDYKPTQSENATEHKRRARFQGILKVKLYSENVIFHWLLNNNMFVNVNGQF